MTTTAPIPVLDKGFVRLVDTMGTDASIVQAARVSYGNGTTTVRSDRTLIRYLMRHHHWTPFEMCEIKFHIKCPIFVARQWLRHRTASVNEFSARYSVVPDNDYYMPLELRHQSLTNKQGSGDGITPMIETDYMKLCDNAFAEYDRLVQLGVAREVARQILPQATYTEFYWKINLRNLFNFIRLRVDRHAQAEIRAYAEVIDDIVRSWVPIAHEAFQDYIVRGVSLSRVELEWVRQFLPTEAPAIAPNDMSRREYEEMVAKLWDGNR